MSYYQVLGLKREPFSTSPDPSFFFLSSQHKAAFFRLQIAVKLKRGMSVLMGDVGTGKTTLSRKLSQVLNADPDVMFHMILNPYFGSEEEFLSRLAAIFHVDVPASATGLDYIEAIEKFLFKRGVEEGKTVVLLVDEAQILPDFAFEVLRILLNYETNEFKILQLILVGQLELLPRISGMENFWDRIAMRYILNPLAEDDVRRIIEFRLRQAGYEKDRPLFTNKAIKMIAAHTQGYPRKLSLLCHNSLENLVMYDKEIVDEDIVRSVVDGELRKVDAKTAGSEVSWHRGIKR